MPERGVALNFQTRRYQISELRQDVTQVELVYRWQRCLRNVNYGGDNITPGEDVSRTKSDFEVGVVV